MKRSKGEGTICQHKSGLWQGQIRLPDGTRRSFYRKTPAAVSKAMRDAYRAAERGLPVPKERLTVAEYLTHPKEGWLTIIQPTVKAKTWQRYKELVTLHLVPALGKTPLVRLTPAQVQALYADKQRTLTATTVHHLHAVLHAALEKAVRLGLLASNVTNLVDPPRMAPREMQTLSEREVQALLEAAQADRLYPLYLLALTTGMRQGELLALHWRDVDLDHHTLAVRYTLENVGGRLTIRDPKTPAARRRIDLLERTVAALRAHKKRQNEERLALGEAWHDQDLVFTNQIGGPLDATALVKRSFRPLLDQAGLPRLRFHDLRHTFATLAIARRVPVKKVSEMLGHADVATTLRIYAHVTPSMQGELVAALEAVFGR